jgi:hypothetical protein
MLSIIVGKQLDVNKSNTNNKAGIDGPNEENWQASSQA